MITYPEYSHPFRPGTPEAGLRGKIARLIWDRTVRENRATRDPATTRAARPWQNSCVRLGMVLAAGLIAVAGCGRDGRPSTTTTTATRPPTSTSTSTTIGIGAVPDVVDKDLGTARSTLAAAGFNRLTANDGTQKKRVPDDRWIVYRQLPPAGAKMLTSENVSLDVLPEGERYQSPGTSPCPRLVQC